MIFDFADKIKIMIQPLILTGLICFCLIDNALIFGQDDKKTNSISVGESYKLITANRYVADLINHKYADTTITNFIKFDESFDLKGKQDYYEYWIYQEQPKIKKISKILILRINRFTKLISVYDTEKDLVIPLNEWIEKKK